MSAVEHFDSTVAARWRNDLRGRGTGDRRHWRTKIAHYRAVDELLRADPECELGWQAVVAAVRPKGSRSTFYDVTGANATHALIARYQATRTVNGHQIVLAYKRSSAVEQLIDETKVWSFWTYREDWLAYWRGQREVDDIALAESLKTTVGEWARDNRSLAAALLQAPPICAAEDLTLIHQGNLPALRAVEALRAVAAKAVEDPPGYVGGVAPMLATLIPAPCHPEADELLLGLADTNYRLGAGLRAVSRA